MRKYTKVLNAIAGASASIRAAPVDTWDTCVRPSLTIMIRRWSRASSPIPHSAADEHEASVYGLVQVFSIGSVTPFV